MIPSEVRQRLLDAAGEAASVAQEQAVRAGHDVQAPGRLKSVADSALVLLQAARLLDDIPQD